MAAKNSRDLPEISSPRLLAVGSWSRRLASALVTLLVLLVQLLSPSAAPALPQSGGHSHLLGARSAAPGAGQIAGLPIADDVPLLAIGTFPRRVTDRDAARLRALGLEAQPLRRLPMMFLRGTKRQLVAAVDSGAVLDVYPNEASRPLSRESRGAIRAEKATALGLTGQGVGVAIVDTGIDATHPDLKKRVTHNRKLIGPEYLGVAGIYASPDAPPGTLVIPVDALPYNNSDIGMGHGTHVAGIVAADGSANQELLGVAPGAELIGYSVGGEIFFLLALLAAFDDILVHQDAWNIKVVNNSWGSFFEMFNPAHPLNVATKALHDAGIVVVFSAGNEAEEMTINPWSVAPWVISVGSATLARERSEFTSGGLEYDNSRAAAVPPDGHLRFEGDRLGLYHPDVSAPGTDILSTGTPTGVLALAPPGGSATASGTSMSAPHVAGLAAVLLQANPSLTPDQVLQVLQVTARPMRKGASFWESGYGFVDAAAAVELVRRRDFTQARLNRLQAAADQRVKREREDRVLISDHWVFDAPTVTVAGSVAHSFPFEVLPATRGIEGNAAYPTALPLGGPSIYEWQLTLLDPGGREVARSAPSSDAGTSSFFFNGDQLGASPGMWTLRVSGQLSASQPALPSEYADYFEPKVSVAVAQLVPE